MRFTFSRALADFGSVTVRMPFLNDAAIVSELLGLLVVGLKHRRHHQP
jgi:hypothetical protein